MTGTQFGIDTESFSIKASKGLEDALLSCFDTPERSVMELDIMVMKK